MTEDKDIVVIGAGAAGVGIGVTLRHFGFEDFVILEKDEIGGSFLEWPEEMRLLTPSFQSNQFGLRDLNAITLDTSPGYTLQREHPTGREYSQYLKQVSEYYELPVRENLEVKNIVRKDSIFKIETSKESFKAEFVVWAGGEYSNPRKDFLQGSEHCVHNSQPSSWKEFSQDKKETFIVIGGYESGVDAAIELSKLGHKVIVIDESSPWENNNPDPSRSLAPRTSQRLFEECRNDRITLIGNTSVEKVKKEQDKYAVKTNEEDISVSNPPILATGFKGTASELDHLFKIREGSPVLNEKDESVKTENLFLAGPEVKHGKAIFCFIYKYRKRFPIVVEEIAERNGRNVEKAVEKYKEENMYIDDPDECCEDICRC